MIEWREDFYKAARLAILGLNETVETVCWHKEYRFFVMKDELVADIFYQRIRYWTISGQYRSSNVALVLFDNYDRES